MATEYGGKYEDMGVEEMTAVHRELLNEAVDLRGKVDALYGEANYVNRQAAYLLADQIYGIKHGDVLKRTVTNQYNEKRTTYWRIEHIELWIGRGDAKELRAGVVQWRKDGKPTAGRRRTYRENVRFYDKMATHPRNAWERDEKASAAAHAWKAEQEAERKKMFEAQKDKAHA